MTKYVCPKITSVGNKDHNVGTSVPIRNIAVQQIFFAAMLVLVLAGYSYVTVNRDKK